MLNEWRESLQRYHQSLSTKLYFARHGDNLHDIPDTIYKLLPRIKTNFYPRREKCSDLLTRYTNNINDTILIKILLSNKNFNLIDINIIRKLQELGKNKSIVIKPADKNLGLVIMNAKDYEEMCFAHLLDTTTYTNVTIEYTFLIHIIWQDLRNILKAENLYYSKKSSGGRHEVARALMQLVDDESLRIPPFYCLPKVHKQLLPLPGRPIASAPSSITYHTSLFVHKLLLPLIQQLNTICTSSRQILIQCQSINNLPPTAIILTADVKALYPSIPIDAGIAAVRRIMIQFNYMPEYQQLILNLLSWVLTNNFCIFDSTIYKQINGTAMGTPLAPTYAQIFMFDTEQHILGQPIFYKRYIDDIFAIYKYEADARIFVENFNAQFETLKLESIH